nr:hypothetical protein [Tanacetum cinerariifolium]
MGASAIIVSSYSSDESVGSPPSRVILFGDIPTVIPSTFVISPETSAIAHVISSTTPVVETTLVTSPTGLCGLVPYLDFDSDSPDEMDSPEYITTTLMLLPLLVGGAGRVSPRSSDHRLSSSSLPTDSLHVHSSGLDAPDQAHSGSLTRVVSPRLGYPPVRAPRHRDSSKRPLYSSSHSAGPSRKRCRSPANSIPSSTLVTGSLAPTRADLLPPRKRFRDSYSFETSMEEDTEIDTIETEDGRELDIVDTNDVRNHVEIDPKDVRDDTEEYEADTSAGDTVEVGIDPMSAPVAYEESEEHAGDDSSYSSGTRDGIVRSFEDMPIDLDDDVRDFYHHMSEVRIDRIARIEIVQRRLEADQLIASGERARMTERIESLRSKNLKEEFRQIHDDRDDLRRRFRRLESYVERHLCFRP